MLVKNPESPIYKKKLTQKGSLLPNAFLKLIAIRIKLLELIITYIWLP